MNLLLCSQTKTFKHKINNRINDTLASEFESDNLTKHIKWKNRANISFLFLLSFRSWQWHQLWAIHCRLTAYFAAVIGHWKQIRSNRWLSSHKMVFKLPALLGTLHIQTESLIHSTILQIRQCQICLLMQKFLAGMSRPDTSLASTHFSFSNALKMSYLRGSSDQWKLFPRVLSRYFFRVSLLNLVLQFTPMTHSFLTHRLDY